MSHGTVMINPSRVNQRTYNTMTQISKTSYIQWDDDDVHFVLDQRA